MSSLLAIAIFGILSSLATEAFTWLNAKLNGTVLQGKGAFILSIIVAFVGAFVKVIWSGTHFDMASLGTAFSQVWASAQIFFVLIVEWLGITVKE